MTNNIDYILDSVGRQFHGDDAFFAQDLVNSTLSRIFDLEYPELGWLHGGLLNMSQEVDPGARSYDYLEMGSAGFAEIVSDNATDLPNIDLNGQRTPRSIATVACSFQYSTQDLRQAALMSRQGVPFDIADRKARAAREAHDRRINQLLATGNGAAGLYGITNHPGIDILDATTGTWSSATSAQIAADFDAAYSQMIGDTSGVERPDTCVVSPTIFARLRGLAWNSANSSNVSTMEYLENAYSVKFKMEATMLTAAADSGEALLMYRNSPEKAFGVMPLLLQPQPVIQDGLVFKVALESRFGGVAVPRPKSVLRLDGV